MIKATIIGRLGKDAEEATQGQRQVVRFRMATDERKKDASGQWVKDTTWVSVQTYQTALRQWLTKGKQVLVMGDLKVGLWTKQDGTATVDVAVYNADVQLIGGDTQQGTQQAPQQTQTPRVEQQPTQTFNAPQSGADDELPF